MQICGLLFSIYAKKELKKKHSFCKGRHIQCACSIFICGTEEKETLHNLSRSIIETSNNACEVAWLK